MGKEKVQPHDAVFKPSVEPKKLKSSFGYDFNQGFDLGKFLDSYYSTGFQATNLGHAIELCKRMRKEKVTIFFGFTSNVISSGLRDIVRYLCEHKMVDVIVTTTGGIEEDIAKVHAPFLLGSFEANGAQLREEGINRTGNLFIPNERYIWLESFMQPVLKKMAEEQRKTGKIISSCGFVNQIGKAIASEKNAKSSYLYWCVKNNIPVFCPAITDGALGDHVYFFKQKYKDFQIDVADDVVAMNNLAINAENTGAIIIGGGLPKHHIMNANMMREGTKYTVYLNTAVQEDGSNAGATPEEAKSWGKAVPQSELVHEVKVWGDATITFPLLVAGAFLKK